MKLSEELFQSLFSGYQIGLETSMKGNDSIFDNYEEINYPSEKDNWKKIGKNSLTIALNVLYAKNEKTYPAFVLKNKENPEKQITFLLFLNGEG